MYAQLGATGDALHLELDLTSPNPPIGWRILIVFFHRCELNLTDSDFRSGIDGGHDF